jgi:hypothetical protein
LGELRITKPSYSTWSPWVGAASALLPPPPNSFEKKEAIGYFITHEQSYNDDRTEYQETYEKSRLEFHRNARRGALY